MNQSFPYNLQSSQTNPETNIIPTSSRFSSFFFSLAMSKIMTDAQKEEKSEKTLNQPQPSSDTSPPPPLVEEARDESKDPSDKKESNGASANDTQKKIRRAERFGMPVKLSEQEKRNSRAER